MILKLNSLLITSTHTGNAWLTLVDNAAVGSGGCYLTSGYLITAFDTTGRVWISNQSPDAQGEGMETTASRLEAWLIDQLFTTPATFVEIERPRLNSLLAEFYRREF